MRKIFLLLVFSMLAVGISFSVFIQGGQALTPGGPAIYEQEDWETMYRELSEEYNTLRTYYDTLYEDFNHIMELFDSLEAGFEEFESEFETLKSDYAALRSDYKALDIKYRSALRELNTRTTMMYVFVVTTAVFLATTLYLALRRSKTKT